MKPTLLHNLVYLPLLITEGGNWLKLWLALTFGPTFSSATLSPSFSPFLLMADRYRSVVGYTSHTCFFTPRLKPSSLWHKNRYGILWVCVIPRYSRNCGLCIFELKNEKKKILPGFRQGCVNLKKISKDFKTIAGVEPRRQIFEPTSLKCDPARHHVLNLHHQQPLK